MAETTQSAAVTAAINALSRENMDTLKRLRQRRKYPKRLITQHINLLESTNTHAEGTLESILCGISDARSRYDTIQTQIEEQFTTVDELEADRETFDERCFDLERRVRQFLVQVKQELRTNAAPTTPTQRPHLPEIAPPTFSGERKHWLSFKRVFDEIVGNRTDINSPTKYLYLSKSCLGGTAAHIVDSVQNSDYETARSRLTEKYDNDVQLKVDLVNELYDVAAPKDESKSLNTFISRVETSVANLLSIGVATTSWDLLLVKHLSTKLDTKAREDLERQRRPTELLTFAMFLEFLKARVRMLEIREESLFKPKSTSTPNRTGSKPSAMPATPASPVDTALKYKCVVCGMNHMIYYCEEFKKLTGEQRFEKAKQLRLCFNCLSSTHPARLCKSGNCQKCNKRHHTLLHSDVSSKDDSQRIDTSQKEENHSEAAKGVSQAAASTSNKTSTVVLATALILLDNGKGVKYPCRAFLDSGSSVNFITTTLQQRMMLKRDEVNMMICGANGNETTNKYQVSAIIHAMGENNYKQAVDFLVTRKITGELPLTNICIDGWELPSKTQLADPNWNTPGRIDVLLGAEVFYNITMEQKRQLHNLLWIYSSKLGHIVCGKIDNNKQIALAAIGQQLSQERTVSKRKQSKPDETMARSTRLHSFINWWNQNKDVSGNDEIKPEQFSSKTQVKLAETHRTDNATRYALVAIAELQSEIKKFWELDHLSEDKARTMEEKAAEDHYAAHAKLRPDHHYELALPFNNRIYELGDSAEVTKKIFYAAEARRLKTPEKHDAYVEFMTEMLRMGHMEEAPVACQQKCYYMTHHMISRPTSTTTKYRVVFNASHRTSSKISLNDALLVGPTIQAEIFTHLLRWREFGIGITSDAEKMYRQIYIREGDRDYQRIWWRRSVNEPLKAYRMTTVVYGTASAPFHAIRTLKQLAMDNYDEHSAAATIFQNNFYMDDLVMSIKDEESAGNTKAEVNELAAKGGFKLRKWSSNAMKLNERDLTSDTTAVLGVQWDKVNDLIILKFGPIKAHVVTTKSTILSEIASLFDPLGLLAPVVLKAKVLMQNLWYFSEGWDDDLPMDITTTWIELREQLNAMEPVKIERSLIVTPVEEYELHGFCDASIAGYGACCYAVGDGRSRLICAKSRVAPLKPTTIPRLELCAAVLLVHLMDKVIKAMSTKFASIYYWSDSEINLFRIKGPATKYNIFVASRVGEIQELSMPSQWLYVDTARNPADIVSRGATPLELSASSMWWQGPEFLLQARTEWPDQSKFQQANYIADDEMKKTQFLVSKKED